MEIVFNATCILLHTCYRVLACVLLCNPYTRTSRGERKSVLNVLKSYNNYNTSTSAVLNKFSMLVQMCVCVCVCVCVLSLIHI